MGQKSKAGDDRTTACDHPQHRQEWLLSGGQASRESLLQPGTTQISCTRTPWTADNKTSSYTRIDRYQCTSLPFAAAASPRSACRSYSSGAPCLVRQRRLRQHLPSLLWPALCRHAQGTPAVRQPPVMQPRSGQTGRRARPPRRTGPPPAAQPSRRRATRPRAGDRGAASPRAPPAPP